MVIAMIKATLKYVGGMEVTAVVIIGTSISAWLVNVMKVNSYINKRHVSSLRCQI